MNEQQHALIVAAQDLVAGILTIMAEDPFHAPADWVLENLWNTLEAVKHAC